MRSISMSLLPSVFGLVAVTHSVAVEARALYKEGPDMADEGA